MWFDGKKLKKGDCGGGGLVVSVLPIYDPSSNLAEVQSFFAVKILFEQKETKQKEAGTGQFLKGKKSCVFRSSLKALFAFAGFCPRRFFRSIQGRAKTEKNFSDESLFFCHKKRIFIRHRRFCGMALPNEAVTLK